MSCENVRNLISFKIIELFENLYFEIHNAHFTLQNKFKVIQLQN